MDNQEEKILYVKKSESIKISKNERKLYHQCFISDNFAVAPRTHIMNYFNMGLIDMDDVQIVEFIYESQFCTTEQIERFCTLTEIADVNGRIHELVGYGAITAFFIMDKRRVTVNPTGKEKFDAPKDAKLFYCLKSNGRYLLEHFSNRIYIDWEPGYNIQKIKYIENCLANVEIYLDIIATNYEIKAVEKNPLFEMKNKDLIVQSYYGIGLNNNKTKYIIFDTIRMEDSFEDTKRKLRELESLLTTNIWKKYFCGDNKKPVLVLITDNDDAAIALAKVIAESTKFQEDLLFTTFDRIQTKGLGQLGRFLEYNKDMEEMKEVVFEFFKK